MEDWQQRVIDERNALSSNLVKLNRFLDDEKALDAVPFHDRKLLIEQRHCMDKYRNVLDQRIARFTKKKHGVSEIAVSDNSEPELPNFEYTEGQDKSGGMPLEPIPEASDK